MAEARFRLPDGRTGTLRGDSMQEIARKAREMGAEVVAAEPEAGSAPLAAVNATGARTLNAISNLAEDVVNIPARIANPALRALAAPVGMGAPLQPTPGSPLARLAESPPQVPMATLPSGTELAAGIESPMQAVMAGQSLGDAYNERLADRRRIAQDNPLATALGSAASDVAALTAARRPLRGPQSGGAFDSRIKQGIDALVSRLNPSSAQAGSRALAGNTAGSGVVRSLAQGAGRVGEAALEGAAMGALQDGDPAELAGVSAGMQAAGSAGNQLRDFMIGPPGDFSWKRTAGSILGGTLALGLLAQSAPFDSDNPLEPLEWLSANFEKVVSGAMLGLGLGLAGRRGSTAPGTMGGYLPNAADALSAVPRTSILEIIRASQNDETIARALRNVPALGEADSKRFVEIMQSDEPVRGLRNWAATTPRIERMLTAPDPRLADVPVTEGN